MEHHASYSKVKTFKQNVNMEEEIICKESELVEIPEATKELSKKIQPINKETVHRICSGQVVLSLAVAVKELVENSIDAGATLIEVKLKEQGLECVEVSDNGSGVEEKNFEGISAKYHTSKLREFSDLTDVATFGFRGEALSSLCALSDMVITTKYKSANIGTRLELDHEGKIKKQISCARETGTTVFLSNLFSTLPVRKREFQKNIKKEFTKMCQILQAYCLVSKGIKIICTNQNQKGSKSVLMSTHGTQNILDNIVSVFGPKQATELIQIKPPIAENEKFNEDNFTELQDVSNSSLQISSDDIEKLNFINFKTEGWISSCSHGSGRSSKDRQYFYVNSRPCDPKNISKIINEVYHRYNVHQYPFVFLNLILERSDVDVNVTPDKRQLLFNNEKILLLAIKKALMNTFGNIPSTFKIQNSTLLDFNVKHEKLQADFSKDNINGEEENDDDIAIPNSQKFMESLSQWKATGSTLGPSKPVINKRKPADEITERTLKMRKIQEYLSQSSKVDVSKTTDTKFYSYHSDESNSDDEKSEISKLSNISFNASRVVKESLEFDVLTQLKPIEIATSSPKLEFCPNKLNSNSETDNQTEVIKRISCKNIEPRISENFLEKYKSSESTKTQENLDLFESTQETYLTANSQNNPSITILLDESDDDEDKSNIENTTAADEISISIEEIRKLSMAEDEHNKTKKINLNLKRLRFKNDIDPNKNKSAEEELEREINKEMFAQMKIIGQFNLGFIIVSLNQDLFIVDQHASDEKYNFEDLQKTTILQNQMLAIPERLELTAVDEMILIDNLKIFEANGFKFAIDSEAPVTKKIKLLAKPFSKNWQFDKTDIADLIFMLQDAPEDTMVRPSKVRSMFASRACRKSVMIGQTLSKSDMRRLVNHMGEIEHPWNCPHGRPTMRHLINLEMLKDNDEQS